MEETPSVTVLDPVANQLKELDPDVVITCVYDCIPWHTALRNANWSPKAQVFTICIGDQSYKETYDEAAHWVRKVKVELQQHGDTHGDKQEALRKQEEDFKRKQEEFSARQEALMKAQEEW